MQPMLLIDVDSLSPATPEYIKELATLTNQLESVSPFRRKVATLGFAKPYSRECRIELAADNPESISNQLSYLEEMKVALIRDYSRTWQVNEVELQRICFFQNQILLPEQSWAKFHEFSRKQEGAHARPLTEELIAKSKERLVPADGIPTLLCTNEGFHNWGHFLVEDLPRIVAFIQAKRTAQVRLVLTRSTEIVAELDQQKMNLLNSLFPKKQLLFEFAPRNVKYFFEKVSYVTPSAMHAWYHSPDFFEIVKTQLSMHHSAPKNLSRKLFVLRRRNRLLEPDSLAALIPEMQARGFEVVYPEDLSGYEQAQLFASAIEIVGLMGAAMANTIFCSKDTKVTYLSPENWINIFYWDLANIFKRDFYAYYGTSIPDETIHPDKLNYSINVARFLQFLDNS
jgi:capsular polysaccharide biosynthesis protein